uniref:BED-type domain-containing protein n=1 Tax=Strongyloides papillosus TaxID=174720 RepID=A0A0N5C7Z3_STREA
MKSDSLGLTRILNDTHRICNYCGIEYKLSTSSYTIFKHCAKHAPFHSILIRHLGNHSFQNYLSMVPPDYVDPPPIDPDFESKLAKKNGFVNGEKKKEPSPGILDSRSLCDILKFGDGKTGEQSVTPTLTNLSNLFNTLDEVSKVNMSEEKNGSLKVGDSSSDEKSKEDNETIIDDPLHDPMVEEIMKNPEQLPSGFRKRLKTDNLKLTKLVSVKHRICLACNRRFMSSCGVTSLYKHCAKHPEFREILRKNLTPSALENAMRGAKVLPNNTSMANYSRKDVSSKVDENSTNNSFGSFNVDNLFRNETIKSNDNSFFELLRNNLSSNQQLDGDVVPPPCKRPKSVDGDRSTDSPLLLQDDTVKAKTPENEDLSSLCIQFSEDKNFPIERYDSLEFQNLLKYGRDAKDVPQINSDLIYQLKSKEFIEEMSNKINWDGNFGKVSLSVDEIALNPQKTIASIIVHYMDSEYKTNSVTVGFVVVKNDGNRKSVECVLQEIEKILQKYNINKSNIVAVLSDKSSTSKKVIENWEIPEIVCLRREIESIIDLYDESFSITLRTLFVKAISLFSIYNSLYSTFPVTTDFFKLPKGKVFTFSSHWTYTCYIFLESMDKINDINDFASKYCPFLLLTSDEILSLQLLNNILKIFANFCTRFFDEGRGLYYYIPIVQDLYDDINKLNLDDPTSSVKTDLTYKSPKCLLKAPSSTYLWFDAPDEKINTGISKKNCITIVKEFHEVIKEKLVGLKNKVYGDKLLLKALYLNSVEVFRIKYGKEEFWDELGNSLDPETESVPENQGRVSFGQSTKTKGQKYNIFVTENESYTVEEFWKLHKSSFKKLHEYVKTIFCIPAYGLSLEKYNDILSDSNDNCVDENYSTILAYKISRISN